VVRIAWIFDKLQASSDCPGLDGGSAYLQQRAHQLPGTQWSGRRHARQTQGTGAAKKPLQHRFDLIIGVVRQQQMLPHLQRVPKSLVASAAGRRLHTGSIEADLNTSNIEINTEGLTGPLAGQQPLVGFSLQAMVYVNCPYQRTPIAAKRLSQVQ
jgi:hypothetical protein